MELDFDRPYVRPAAVNVAGWACIAAGAVAGVSVYGAEIASCLSDWRTPSTSQPSFLDLLGPALVTLPLAVCALFVAGGWWVLRGDEWWRRLLTHLTAALLPFSLLFTVMFCATGLTDTATMRVDWHFHEWHEFVFALVSVAIAFVLAGLLVALNLRPVRAAMSAGEDALAEPAPPLLVLMLGWAAIAAGALAAAGVATIPVALIATAKPSTWHWADAGYAVFGVIPIGIMLAISGWLVFGGIALLELREYALRWLTNLVIVGFGLALLCLGPSLTELVRVHLSPQAARWLPSEPGEVARLPWHAASAILSLALLRLLQSKLVTGPIRAAEARRRPSPPVEAVQEHPA